MKQLTKNELEELSRLWEELARLSDGVGPPLTYDEMIEAGVDALVAGSSVSTVMRVAKAWPSSKRSCPIELDLQPCRKFSLASPSSWD
jgi:hypothetical protein